MHGEMKETHAFLRELNRVLQAKRLLILTVIIQHFEVMMLGCLSVETRGAAQTPNANCRLQPCDWNVN